VIHVLLADDHETVRHGLKLLIDGQSDMKVVAEVGSGHEAVQRTRAVQPAVVVLDLSMPDGGGLEAAREIAAADARVAIVALTRHNDQGYVQALLGAGVRAYVLKQSSSSELLNAIRAAAAGSRYLDAALADKVTGAFIARHAVAEPVAPRISDREAEVLRLIAVGYSNREIAGRLNLSVKTIEVHKANAMRKLQLRGRVDIVKYAVGRGWLHDA
jgi:DNA-binding NarL/FixJ family response regulator